MNTIAKRLGVPEVAESDPIQPLSDSSPSLPIFEGFEPISEWALAALGQVLFDPSRPDLHPRNVSYRIHLVKAFWVHERTCGGISDSSTAKNWV
jgi:hypothetical protein